MVATSTIPTPAAGKSGKNPQQNVVLAPFVRGALDHTEPANIDQSRQLGANPQQVGPFPVPANGFLRNLYVLVELTGGVGAGVVAQPDAIWSVLQDIRLTDVGGNPLIGVTGFELQQINRWGGYAFADPSASPLYSAIAASGGNGSFLLRIPVELSMRDALGSLKNMNAAQAFQFTCTIAPSASVYSTPPGTTLPTVRVRVWAESWVPADENGATPTATEPPAVGTTAYWHKQIVNVAAGQQTIPIAQVGNLIRNMLLIYRDNTGARQTTVMDPLAVMWDGRLLFSRADALLKHVMWERSLQTPDQGVRLLDWTHEFDGSLGSELRDQWLRTEGSTRLELQATFPVAGTLTVLVNDVAVPAGADIYVS
jgi:hypothetical protein